MSELEKRARLRRERAERKRVSVKRVEKEIRRSRRAENRQRNLRDFLIVLILSVAVASVLTMQFITMVHVNGTGMSPTIQTGSTVACLRQTAPFIPKAIKRDELVLVRRAGNLLVRRAAGIEGDIIDYRNGLLYINNVPKVAMESDASYPYTLDHNQLFLLADNAMLGIDSRSREFGLSSQDDVIARPIMAFWPIYTLGWLR